MLDIYSQVIVLSIDELESFLGKNLNLLSKSYLYLSSDEQWRLIQILLYFFGVEINQSNIILFKQDNNQVIINKLKNILESLLQSRIESKVVSNEYNLTLAKNEGRNKEHEQNNFSSESHSYMNITCMHYRLYNVHCTNK